MARKPKNSKIVTLSLDCDLMDLLEKYCERDRRTKSSAIELAIEKYLIAEGFIKEGELWEK